MPSITLQHLAEGKVRCEKQHGRSTYKSCAANDQTDAPVQREERPIDQQLKNSVMWIYAERGLASYVTILV